MSQLTLEEIKEYLKNSILNSYRTKNEHKITEDYFNKIDTEEKAYFLGLLMADGNVATSNNRSWRFSIALASEDKYILKKLRKAINPSETIKLQKIMPVNSRCMEQTRICVYSNKLSYDLINLGCVPNKSLILKFPNNLIKDELIPHFIRGYFDGDGGFIKQHSEVLVTKIVSSSTFINSLSEWFNINGIKNSIYLCDNPLNSFLIIGYYESLKFYNLIYKNADFYLKRKKRLFYRQSIKKLNILLRNEINPQIIYRHRYKKPHYELYYFFEGKKIFGGTFHSKTKAIKKFRELIIPLKIQVDSTKKDRIEMIQKYINL